MDSLHGGHANETTGRRKVPRNYPKRTFEVQHVREAQVNFCFEETSTADVLTAPT